MPQRATSISHIIALLGTLFQFQSDKNKVMDVNEATEFGISLTTSLKISKDIYGYMKTQNCSMEETATDGSIKNFGRIEPGCFRANFWKGLCTNYRQYYPLMFESIKDPNAPRDCEQLVVTEKAALLIDRVIKAARSCNRYTDGQKEEIFYSEGDIMTVLLALIHVETTVLRWDENGNNIMDPKEVDNAYEIYSPALDGFLEGKDPIVRKFKKQIYQYLVKYETVPDESDFSSIWKFINFLISFKKDVTAERKTIASILVALAAENKKTETGPILNCNLLRNPETIPRNTKNLYPSVELRSDFSNELIPYLNLAN